MGTKKKLLYVSAFYCIVSFMLVGCFSVPSNMAHDKIVDLLENEIQLPAQMYSGHDYHLNSLPIYMTIFHDKFVFFQQKEEELRYVDISSVKNGDTIILWIDHRCGWEKLLEAREMLGSLSVRYLVAFGEKGTTLQKAEQEQVWFASDQEGEVSAIFKLSAEGSVFSEYPNSDMVFENAYEFRCYDYPSWRKGSVVCLEAEENISLGQFLDNLSFMNKELIGHVNFGGVMTIGNKEPDSCESVSPIN